MPCQRQGARRQCETKGEIHQGEDWVEGRYHPRAGPEEEDDVSLQDIGPEEHPGQSLERARKATQIQAHKHEQQRRRQRMAQPSVGIPAQPSGDHNHAGEKDLCNNAGYEEPGCTHVDETRNPYHEFTSDFR